MAPFRQGLTVVTLKITLLPRVTGGSGGRGSWSLNSSTTSLGSAHPRAVTVVPPFTFTVRVRVTASPGFRVPEQSFNRDELLWEKVLQVTAGFDEVGTAELTFPNRSKKTSRSAGEIVIGV